MNKEIDVLISRIESLASSGSSHPYDWGVILMDEHETILSALRQQSPQSAEPESSTAEHWMLKAHEFQSRLYASGNYIANDAVHATEFKFANGRRVWVGQDGFLQCSYEATSQEEAPIFTSPQPAQESQELTDEEITGLWLGRKFDAHSHVHFARAIIAASLAKNGGGK